MKYILLVELKEQSQVGVSGQQFDAALKLLADEEFLVVTRQNIRVHVGISPYHVTPRQLIRTLTSYYTQCSYYMSNK